MTLYGCRPTQHQHGGIPHGTDAEVCNLLTLGLAWASGASVLDLRASRTGNGVLQTLRLADAISAAEHQRITQKPSESLKSYLTKNSHLVYPDTTKRTLFSQPEIRRALGGSDKLWAVLIHTPMFFPDMIVGSRGYRLLVTARGQEYAQQIAPNYAPQLTRDIFAQHWDDHRRQMRNLHALWPWGNAD